MKRLVSYALFYIQIGLLSEDRWIYFCYVDFVHMNLDTTIMAHKFDEMQTRLWFLAGAGSWATVGNDFVIRIWKLLKDGELNRIQELTEHTDVVTEVMYASKIDCLITSSLDGTMKMFSASNFRLRHTETLSKKHGYNSNILKGSSNQSKKEGTLEGIRGRFEFTRFSTDEFFR